MYKHVRVIIALVFILSCLAGVNVAAASVGVVVTQVRAGNSSSGRFVEVYNNSDTDIDITDWCLQYSPPSDSLPRTNLGCFISDSPSIRLMLPARSYAFAVSDQMEMSGDLRIEAGLGTGTSGHVFIVDNQKIIVDRVGWGETAVNAEGNAPVINGATRVVARKVIDGGNQYVDTDNNYQDFEISTVKLVYQYGAIYEAFDACTNLEGIQSEIPSGKVSDGFGGCTDPDVCLNLLGAQVVVPNAFSRDELGYCSYKLLPLQITELLPSPAGDDSTNEFIEIYNPNNESVTLEYMKIQVDSNGTIKEVALIPATLQPQSYAAFYSLSLGFVLPNSTAIVSLVTEPGQLLDQADAYDSPQEEASWARFDSGWSYTNRPTPGAANLPSLVEEAVITPTLKPCGPGQYRNPATNRCKAIVTATSKLVPCKDGQYRSEETNRCRNIAADAAAKSCPVGQYRNPATNRCKSILGASTTLAVCGPGEERNPATNRCRKVQTAVIPPAPFAVEPVATQTNPIDWWVLAGTATVVVGYGVWEWRQEIIGLWKKLLGRLL